VRHLHRSLVAVDLQTVSVPLEVCPVALSSEQQELTCIVRSALDPTGSPVGLALAADVRARGGGVQRRRAAGTATVTAAVGSTTSVGG
jgi:hypothetical protein